MLRGERAGQRAERAAGARAGHPAGELQESPGAEDARLRCGGSTAPESTAAELQLQLARKGVLW